MPQNNSEGKFVFFLKRKEEELWQEAKTSLEIDKLIQYQQLFPKGKYYQDAINEISILTEEQIWNIIGIPI